MFVARVGTLNSRGGVRAVAVRVLVLVAEDRCVDVARAPDAWGRREPSALLGPACERRGRRFRNRSERYHKCILISGSRLGKGRRTANDAPRKPAATGRVPDRVPMGVCKARDAAASNSNGNDEQQGNDNNQRLRGRTSGATSPLTRERLWVSPELLVHLRLIGCQE